MQTGDRKDCAILSSNGKSFVPTGQYIPVEVREIRGNSARVKTLTGKTRYIWVQQNVLKDPA